uniref:Uncharacterized protein n=1 Tax=Arundo donax TaxID=35708 RepID=A0A0A8XTM3_ARUDO
MSASHQLVHEYITSNVLTVIAPRTAVVAFGVPPSFHSCNKIHLVSLQLQYIYTCSCICNS